MRTSEVYVSMGMEYAGELFSRVLGNQASDGAFFTRQSAARLLAELALDATGETAWAERRDVAAAQDGRLGLRERHAVECVPGGGQGSDPEDRAVTNGAQPSSTSTLLSDS